MVGKQSIFSRNYEDMRKKRKRRKIFIFLIIVIVLAAIFLFSKIDYNKITQRLSNPFKKQTNGTSSVKPNATANKGGIKLPGTTASSTSKAADEADAKGYDVKLSDGKVLKAVYDESSKVKKFKYVSPESDTNYYQISPSGNGIIIYDKAAQGMIYVKIDGTITDISQKQYVSSGQTVFQREIELTKNPNYIWCTSPKFIDDENIVYISQLPWFKNDATKYIWSFKLNVPNSYVAYQSLAGNSITIGAVTQGKGISIQYDGNTSYLGTDGSITK